MARKNKSISFQNGLNRSFVIAYSDGEWVLGRVNKTTGDVFTIIDTEANYVGNAEDNSTYDNFRYFKCSCYVDLETNHEVGDKIFVLEDTYFVIDKGNRLEDSGVTRYLIAQ